jgi:hypothetical protein
MESNKPVPTKCWETYLTANVFLIDNKEHTIIGNVKLLENNFWGHKKKFKISYWNLFKNNGKQL